MMRTMKIYNKEYTVMKDSSDLLPQNHLLLLGESWWYRFSMQRLFYRK